MKKILVLFLFLTVLWPCAIGAKDAFSPPANTQISSGNDWAMISWENPDDFNFLETVLFRSTILIEDYFTYEAVAGLCEKIYSGQAENYTDIGLAVNLPYYYILFSRNQSGNASRAVVMEKKLQNKKDQKTGKMNTLAGADSKAVNQVSFNEAGIIYNYNQPLNFPTGDEAGRLALFVIVKSPHDLEDRDKHAISYFIHDGTPTTIILGAGERAGVLNSYLSVFDKLPTNQLEWQDIIKIANGRWPDQRSLESEDRAANSYFSAIYQRQPDMDNPNDSAAVTVIAYGLRPGARNLDSEKKAIAIYRSIFDESPAEATDWDLVRAIAYSGATR
ncbi:MAG: hypothetical protein U9R06_00220 [Patescibacteria group bacterium]|nr:hypothetical protein [Patescibacteria group bacterium]